MIKVFSFFFLFLHENICSGYSLEALRSLIRVFSGHSMNNKDPRRLPTDSEDSD